jgi:predicted phosphodiesterase
MFRRSRARTRRWNNAAVQEPIRIISDLHLGHTASLARDIEQVEPLYHGVKTVILNGDTIEMRSERSRTKADRILAEVEAFCATQSAATYFLNGNHDPIISTLNHLEIDDGSLLVTHGDVLYDNAEKTRRGLRRRGAADERLLFDLDAPERRQLEDILSTNKRVGHAMDCDQITIPNGPWGQFSTFLKQTWPPRRFVHMVSSWRNTHLHAIDLLRAYRPEARCVVVGHTHYPGVWHRHGYTVINTGSFLPMLGRLAVDYECGVVTVRRIQFRRRKFNLGAQVARFPVNGRFRRR